MTSGLRRFFLGVLIFGVSGMSAELLFIGHVEGALQLIPVVLLGCGLAARLWLAAAPGPASVRALQVVMALFVLSGAIGVGLHYRGNVQFELEMYPSLSGMELAIKTLTGATPVLAPGSMALLGLVGLGVIHRHPATSSRDKEIDS